MTARVAYQAWIPPERGFYVYRLWGGDGQCVYVGMVGVRGAAYLVHRLRYHEVHADWWAEVSRADWAAFPGSYEAAAEETRQITEQVPVYNKRRPSLRAEGSPRVAAGAVSAREAPTHVDWSWSARRRGLYFAITAGPSSYFDPWDADAASDATLDRIAAELGGEPPGIRDMVARFITQEMWH